MMPITLADIGVSVRIQKIGGHDDMRRKLSEMGFVAGGEVTVVQKAAGHFIVEVKGIRVALGEELARRIFFGRSQ